MAWMPDEQYVLMQENRDKAITARSARHARTHNGKGGRVKFPSDYLSRKELRAMNGECKSYRLNEPMTWADFKSMPDDLKITYVKSLREKFNVPDVILADALGVNRPTFGNYIRCLHLGLGKSAGAASKNWLRTEDHDKFMAWWHGEEKPVEADNISEAEEEVDEQNISGCEATESPVEAVFERHCEAVEANRSKWLEAQETSITPVIPSMGSMTFDCAADNALAVMENLLRHTKVKLTITWEVVE